MDNSLPGAEKRRRVHLMRHGDVSYVTETGDRVPDAELVPFNERRLPPALLTMS